MLATRPEGRFQTPLELSAALTSCVEQLGLTPPAAALPVYMGMWAPRGPWWRRHAPWIVPFACLAAAVLSLAIIWKREATEPAFPELRWPQQLQSARSTDRLSPMEQTQPPEETSGTR
jgi:hypothetical protein